MEKEILTAKSKYDIETIKKFTRYNFYSTKKMYFICALAFALMIYAIFAKGENTTLRLLIGVIGCVWYIEYLTIPSLHVKKAIKTSRMLDAEINSKFFEDHIEMETIKDGEKKGETNLRYKEIYKVCETKTYLYIYISGNQAFCCSKENMDGDMDRVRNILKEMLGKKYISKIR